MSASALVTLGKITGTFGVSGAVKVLSYTEPPNNLANYPIWYLHHPHHPPVTEQVELFRWRVHGKGFVAQLKTITSPEQAKTLINHLIQIPHHALPKLPDKTYYWIDLVGLRVYNEQQQYLGTISELLATGANDVMVLQTEQHQRLLLPYVMDHIIIHIDLSTQQMIVRWEMDN